MSAALMFPLVAAISVMSLCVVWMKLTPASYSIGVSLAAFVATILLQKLRISFRLNIIQLGRKHNLRDIITESTVDKDITLLI